MRPWLTRSLLSLSVAVACARATDEKLLQSGDDSGGTSGSGASPFGGSAGFGGTTTGGTSTKGGTTTGGASATGGKGGSVGIGGASTTGGTDAGGASDGGEGGTDACSPAGTPPELRIDYKADVRALTEDPSGQLHVVNGTDEPIPLSELKVRYWLHSEFACSQTTDQMVVNVVTFQLQNPFSNKNIPDVTKTIVDLGTGAPGCDAYFELGFEAAAGSLEPEQYAVVGYFAQVPIYTRPHDQSNDYSYGACTTDFAYFDRVTLYRNRRLVSGREPGGGGGEGGAGGENGGGMGGG